VVLGGGPAGIAAAAGRRRPGRALDDPHRGATVSSVVPAPPPASRIFCGLHAKVNGEHRQVVHGVCR